jgi:hypothetical protein
MENVVGRFQSSEHTLLSCREPTQIVRKSLNMVKTFTIEKFEEWIPGFNGHR